MTPGPDLIDEGVMGVDEVGRGPLAGPVVTAAVILSANDTLIAEYKDSKKVSEKKRFFLYHHLRKHAVSYTLGMASVEEIDSLNIHQATMLAMRRAVANIKAPYRICLVDGPHTPAHGSEYIPVIGGDALHPQIAAASIIAKVVRDRLMKIYHANHPCYGFDKHKGYGTAAHMDMLREHGSCAYHRKSFAPVRKVDELRPVLN